MKRIFFAIIMCMPLIAYAQTETTSQDRVAALQAEAAAKAKAAQEAAKAAQEAAIAAQKAAEAAMEEAKKAETEAKEKKAEEAKAAKKEKAEAEAKVKEAVIEKEENAIQPRNTQAEGTTWTAPVVAKESAEEKEKEKKEAEKKTEEAKYSNAYLAEDAVPVVDGEVQWVYELDVPGKDAKQIYDEMLTFLTKMTQEENQLERSKVALVNENEHKIAATMQEWLVFSSSFLSLDRTKFSYMLYANCTDGHLQVILDRISYVYGEGKDMARYKAEEWITDKYAVNKKRTRLYPISGKFRRKTIDRKDEIFKEIKAAVL